MRKVPLEDVEPGDVVATDIKVHSLKPDVQYRIRLDEGRALTEKHIDRLAREGIGYVFIRDPDLDDLDPFIHDRDVQKAEEDVTRELQDIGNDVETGANYNISVDKLRDSLNNLIDSLRGTDAMLAFSSLKSHNDYTAKHSMDVAKLAVHLTLSNEKKIRTKLKKESGASNSYINKYMREDLGLGALLHDIGKWTIPNEVLKKPSGLDNQEWEAMKKHPETAGEMLDDQERELRAPVKIPALQHHEQYGGGGYPRGLEGNDIHLYGRISAVCDVYSALTSDRPYRVRKTPNRARQIMQSMQEDNNHFDPEIFKMFMDAIPPFPIGQQVVLSNGKRGVVAELKEDPRKPVVRVLFEGNTRISEPFEIQVNDEDGPSIIN